MMSKANSLFSSQRVPLIIAAITVFTRHCQFTVSLGHPLRGNVARVNSWRTREFARARRRSLNKHALEIPSCVLISLYLNDLRNGVSAC